MVDATTVLDWQLRRAEPILAEEGLAQFEVDPAAQPADDMLAALARHCAAGSAQGEAATVQPEQR